MKDKIKTTIHFILNVFLLYLVYVLITGILFFLIDYKPTETENLEHADISKYYRNEEGPDRVVLLEEGETALTTRFNVIENAEESIKIANFKLESGEVSDILYALLIEVANRGVQIQLLLDGMAHNLHGPTNELYWALASNPNIEIRFFEPIDFLRPWTLNNRLHDKMIIVDEKMVLTGGRNIGDNYYLKDADGKYAYDRDILIYDDSNNHPDSVLNAFLTYYEELYNHELTQLVEKESLVDFEEQGLKGKKELLDKLKNARERNEFYLVDNWNWEKLSFPTNHVSLITNPIGRWKQSPRILQTLNQLMLSSNNQVIAQTPYLIWNDELQTVFDFDEIEAEIHFLTNSETSTNNFPGVAGFLNFKDELLDEVTQIYGFQGDGSIHAKTYIIDHRLSLIGSFNFDSRSSFLSTENLVIIDSEPFTKGLSEHIYDKMESSKVYKEESNILPESVQSPEEITWDKKALLWLFRILVYPFDELL